MRKAAVIGLFLLLPFLFMGCTRDSGVKSGPAAVEAFLELLPRSTDFILVTNVEKLLAIEAVAKAMEGPGSGQGISGFFKRMGIDLNKDVKSMCLGFPATEWWRRFFLGTPRRQAIVENASIVVDLRYDKNRLQSSIRERTPGLQEDSYGGVAIYADTAADERWTWMRAACLDETHIVLGSDKGVRAVIDVYQRRAEPLSKSPEMTAMLKQVDMAGLAWYAAVAPAELFKDIAGSNPQLADLGSLKGMTLAVDDTKGGVLIEFRSIGGDAKENEASASMLKGLRAYGTMHLAAEPALAELLNSIEITPANGSIRLAGGVSYDALGQLWRLARAAIDIPTEPDDVVPLEAAADVPGPVQGQEAGAQDDAAFHVKIRAQAEEMHRASMSGDLDKFMTFIHPQLIAAAGGPVAFRQALQPVLAQIEQLDVKTSIGTISPVVSEAGGLAAYVPIEMDLRTSETRIIGISYEVAYSEDGGLTWKFVSSQGQPKQDEFVKRLFPRLSGRIAPPKCGQFIPFW